MLIHFIHSVFIELLWQGLISHLVRGSIQQINAHSVEGKALFLVTDVFEKCTHYCSSSGLGSGSPCRSLVFGLLWSSMQGLWVGSMGGGGWGDTGCPSVARGPYSVWFQFRASMAMFICIALLEDRNGLDQRGSNWDQGVTHPRHTPQASFYQSNLGEPDCFKRIAVARVLHPNN